MLTVAATCPYVPPEWIAAHGVRPRRIAPSTARREELARATAGLCPYARAFMNTLADPPRPDAAVFTTVCDQMRRAAEAFAGLSGLPTFLMNVPSTWQTPAAMEMYVDELRRLGRFMEALGGSAPADDELARVMLAYAAARARLRDAQGRFGPRQYAEVWAGLDPSVPPSEDSPDPSPPTDAVPLALVGGPMLREQLEVFDVVERYGGRIVLTAIPGGEMTAPAPFDPDRLREQPLEELARAYLGSIPHAMRRPDTQLHAWLRREVAAAAPRGILFQRYLWCDLWHAELARVREWANLPLLDMDVGDEDDIYRLGGRIQAFIETLQ